MAVFHFVDLMSFCMCSFRFAATTTTIIVMATKSIPTNLVFTHNFDPGWFTPKNLHCGCPHTNTLDFVCDRQFICWRFDIIQKRKWNKIQCYGCVMYVAGILIHLIVIISLLILFLVPILFLCVFLLNLYIYILFSHVQYFLPIERLWGFGMCQCFVPSLSAQTSLFSRAMCCFYFITNLHLCAFVSKRTTEKRPYKLIYFTTNK